MRAICINSGGVRAACLLALSCLGVFLLLPPPAIGQDAQRENTQTEQAGGAEPSEQQQTKRLHALSLVGEPKFSASFKHFDWVNIDAPKGGRLRMWAQGTYDSLNPFTVKGIPANGISLVFDTLMSSSPDEPSTEYGLIAEWVSHPDDYSSVTFGLRKEARFHDGTPITPDDVVFSLQALKSAHPQYAYYYKNVVKAEKTGEREVTFRFDVKGNRELPQIVGQLYILPKHFWTANDEKGAKRDITKTTLEPPLGSGPYKVGASETGRFITYERVKDYWAADLPVAKGQWNFDTVKFTYFRDRRPAFEQFKSGAIDIWEESQAGAWALQYGFDAVKKGLVKKEAIPHGRVAGMQAFIFNLRREKFQDVRVREAFGLAFDFEWSNKMLFYDLYKRTGSFFDNSELKAEERPTGTELQILEELKGKVPEKVFTDTWKNPVNFTDLDRRENLRKASALLEAAGWKPKNGILHNAQGQKLEVEFLLVQQAFERIVLPYIRNLKRLGIEARARLIDSSGYKRRLDQFDYDIIVDGFGQSHSPGNEQRNYWGSAAADRAGSRNSIGIKDAAIDQLIDRIVFAGGREELVAATRALDRVLRWNFFVVPQWHYPFERIASWDKFGRPKKLPSQTASILRTWWIDKGKKVSLAEKLK